MGINEQSRFTCFPEEQIREIALPQRFTFPFYYEPHPLTRLAAASLQHYLEQHTGLNHNFGLTDDRENVIGKMFGVLVARDKAGRVGHLWAFSGKLGNSNDHPMFVPPVFDMLGENSFFLKEQHAIDGINSRVDTLLADEKYSQLRAELAQHTAQSALEIAALKKLLKQNKDARQQRRATEKERLAPAAFQQLEAELVKQSLSDKRQLKALTDNWNMLIEETQASLAEHDTQIDALKSERRERSGALQERLFEQYSFLNKDGKSRNLKDIFSATAFGVPPSAAGECAAPKLLQYAFVHGYTPLAMAEFWWGASPSSDIRKHKQFYPACTGKCKPILEHMLEGIPMDDNPFLTTPREVIVPDIIFEDDYLLVLNKPSGLRSVPGVNVADSVYTRLRATMKETEPLMVHRLDMDTSGLLVVAKTQSVHKHLQTQFLKRTVSKRYTALLSGKLNQTEGEITLPLAADLFNRPRQLVCFETGKKSITLWKVVDQTGIGTRVHFWPLTGRTHQLRMHAAHELGLNTPIVGDDLYGTADKRLYLHAAELTFVHPKTKEKMSFAVEEDF